MFFKVCSYILCNFLKIMECFQQLLYYFISFLSGCRQPWSGPDSIGLSDSLSRLQGNVSNRSQSSKWWRQRDTVVSKEHEQVCIISLCARDLRGNKTKWVKQIQRQRLSRAKHDTFHKWLASIVFCKCTIYVFSFSWNVFLSETFHLVLRIILESFELHYFFLTSNTCGEYFAVRTQIRSDASSC